MLVAVGYIANIERQKSKKEGEAALCLVPVLGSLYVAIVAMRFSPSRTINVYRGVIIIDVPQGALRRGNSEALKMVGARSKATDWRLFACRFSTCLYTAQYAS